MTPPVIAAPCPAALKAFAPVTLHLKTKIKLARVTQGTLQCMHRTDTKNLLYTYLDFDIQMKVFESQIV